MDDDRFLEAIQENAKRKKHDKRIRKLKGALKYFFEHIFVPVLCSVLSAIITALILRQAL